MPSTLRRVPPSVDFLGPTTLTQFSNLDGWTHDTSIVK